MFCTRKILALCCNCPTWLDFCRTLCPLQQGDLTVPCCHWERERDGNQKNTSYLRFDRLGMLLLRVCKDLTFLRNYIGHSTNITSTSCFILFQLAVGNLIFLSHIMFSRRTVQLPNCLQCLLSVSMVPLQVVGA